MTEKHEAAVGLLEEPAEARFMDVEELRGLATEGRERGYLTFEEIAACLEEVEVTKEQISDFRAHLVEAGVDIVSTADGRPQSGGMNDSPRGRGGRGSAQEAGDRPHGRAEPRLAAALPALDRARRSADGGPGGGAGAPHRARRHVREAADDRGEPAPGGVDRQGLPRARAVVPRPDPGGLAGPDPRGREVRLPARLQVLDLRDLVDPPGRDARDRRQGPHHPHPGAHGREAEQGGARGAPARAGVRARADAGGDRQPSSSGRRAR